MMKEYYGIDLLDMVLSCYRRRTEAAVDWGLFDPDSRYHWIYRELRARMQFLSDVRAFIAELPAFIESQGPEAAVCHAVRRITKLFADTPEADGKDLIFSDDNPICRDLMESICAIGTGYDLEERELLYKDLCECAVRAARLYLQMSPTLEMGR